MSQQIIQLSAGGSPGDSLRVGFTKTNSNFTELYAAVAASNAAFGAPNGIATLDGDARLTLSQAPILSFTGDVTGTGQTSIALTLPNTGVTPGQYSRVTVDSKGRVISADQAPNSVALSGDATASGLVGAVLPLTLASTGVAPGSYRTVVVDAKGRVLSGSLGSGNEGLQEVTDRGATTDNEITLSSQSPMALNVAGGGAFGGNMLVGGDLLVEGNFVINGTTTTINSSTVTVDDPAIYVGGDEPPNGPDPMDRGVAFRWHDGTPLVGFFGFDRATQAFKFIPRANEINNVFTGQLGALMVGTLIADSIVGDGPPGIIVRPANGPFIARAITAGDGMTVASGDGIAGNPVVGITPVETAGEYRQVTVNNFGQVTGGLPPIPETMNLTGDATGVGTLGGAMPLSLASTGVSPGTYTRVAVDTKGRVVSASQAADSLVFTSDATGSGTVGGSITLTLASTGVSPGTYTRVAVDEKGRVISASQAADSLVFTSDATGMGTVGGSISLTLADTGVSPGTYTRVSVDAKGRVTAADQAASTVAFSGDATGSGSVGGTISLTLADTGVGSGQYTRVTVDTKGRVVSADQAPSTVIMTGDATGTGTVGGSIPLILANSGVSAGSYTQVTVDAKGRVTAGDNPAFLLSESDTLDSVTSRGAATSNSLSIGQRLSVLGDGANNFWLRTRNGSENASGGQANAIGISMDAGSTAVQSIAFAATGQTIGQITATGFMPGASETYDLGTPSLPWRNIYGSVTAIYADLAERYAASEPLAPGDLVEIGGEAEVQKTRGDATTEVFGVVSTLPAIRLNDAAGDDLTHPFIALSGRVPCRVQGPVRKGQRLVASASPGVARGATNADPIFGIFGRALAAVPAGETALVEVVVGGR